MPVTGLGPRDVFVNGNPINYVVYANPAKGVVEFTPHPLRAKRNGEIYTRRLRGSVIVKFRHSGGWVRWVYCDELQTKSPQRPRCTDPQDAVKAFTSRLHPFVVREGSGNGKPVTLVVVAYSGRGVLARYKLRRIDGGSNILHGDLKLTRLH